MDRPAHITAMELAHQKSAGRRTLSVVLVGGLHVLAIWGLALGLASNETAKIIHDVKVAVIKEKPPAVKPPPPPPPDFKIPPPDFVPPPDINIESAPTTNAITQVQTRVQKPPPAAPPPKAAVVTTPVSIGRPHECSSKYPPLAYKLSQEGTVGIKMIVEPDGSVSNVKVVKPSGHSSLDDAAIRCAGEWHYKPSTRDGKAIAVPWSANVVYKLP